ncbi:gephyrin-like molybdotransferase Glp [Microbacterium sp. APC 3901]|uniref:molybdopterin molybdotransferase MoeA n=1 Tax=Microbacterium sp. APC 3901 TaxID=3035192 RepID=UPI0025B49F87|nr:gephyrin-like molybdotransferase Glp [Microbacterium sp. APC 3901]MDN3445048.1 molybdopterin molybdotransferase MoeA [Microbacterium sp. APC 3901]
MRHATSLAPPVVLTVEEQQAKVLAASRPLTPETVPIARASGRTLAAAVHARVDVPLFDNSAMDGYAVIFSDVEGATAEHPAELRVIADLPAGSAEEPELRPGLAARIMTGAPVPRTANTVVPFEHTRDGLRAWDAAAIVTTAPLREGANIRRCGEELRAGAVVARAGTVLGPLQLTAIAATGVDTVQVHRRPRVAVISTGTELAAPGADLDRGQIPESNSVLLASMCVEAGADVISVDTVTDEDAAFTSLLDRALHAGHADVVVTSGGVSAGAHEVVKNVLRDRIEFTAVAMQPGRPQAFGRIDDALIFGLPGNPASVAASFEAFVRPALLAQQGRESVHRPMLRLATAAGWRSPTGRQQYVPVALDRSDPAAWSVSPAAADGSSGAHLAAGLARADAYAVVRADVSAVAAGDLVDVMLLS